MIPTEDIGQQKYDILAAALAVGQSQQQAADTAGVSKGTVQRLLRDEAFSRRVADFRRPAVMRVLGLLNEASIDAATALHLIVQDMEESAAVRVNAAKAIVELATKLRGVEEMDQRLRKLEEQLARPSGTPEAAGTQGG
jgi:transcriptional regulator with XRE-family HTH domain